MSSIIERIMSRVNVNSETGCWIWNGILTRGYGQLKVDGKMLYVHRLMFTEVHGSIPEGLLICHHCDVRNCCNPDHLFAGTYVDNRVDAARKGRLPSGDRHYARLHPESRLRGEKNPKSILTEAQVIQIRQRYKEGNSGPSLSAMLGVSHKAVYDIIHRRTWKHVADERSDPAQCCAGDDNSPR